MKPAFVTAVPMSTAKPIIYYYICSEIEHGNASSHLELYLW